MLIAACRMLAFIHVFSICVVGAILFVSVDEIQPNRRYASVLRLCKRRSNRKKTDALAASWAWEGCAECEIKGTPGETARGSFYQLRQLVAKFTKSAAITHSLLT